MLRRCDLSNENEYVLEVENISKTFPGVKALSEVTMKVRKGTVHALMGENGAGKSTLMKIVSGVYKADPGGIIKVDGKVVENNSIIASLHNGVSMIFQELNPIPNMTVAENIFLNREPTKGIFVDKKKMIKMTEELFISLGIKNIKPTDKMYKLTVAKKQMVEITKAISYNSKLIIMDEPTSAITDKEVDHLFAMVRKLKKEGVAFVFITHKMDEVFQITDEITVFRDGRYIGTDLAANSSRDKLIAWMVGREITQMFPKEEAEIGEVILSARGLTRKGVFENVSFELRKGEILGFAGLMGAGRTEVMEALYGYTKLDAGEVFVHGKKVNIASPAEAMRNRMALLTEDRKGTGCFLPLSVRDNMVVACMQNYTKLGFLKKHALDKACLDQKNKLAVKTPNLQQRIGNLSGGNQQKVLIARWLLTNPEILIVDEPTRGIDVGAKSEIHKLLSLMAKEGRAVIMISSELPEVMGMSDRIMVMHEGKITGEVARKDANQTRIMEYATNSRRQNPA